DQGATGFEGLDAVLRLRRVRAARGCRTSDRFTSVRPCPVGGRSWPPPRRGGWTGGERYRFRQETGVCLAGGLERTARVTEGRPTAIHAAHSAACRSTSGAPTPSWAVSVVSGRWIAVNGGGGSRPCQARSAARRATEQRASHAAPYFLLTLGDAR